MLLLGAGRGEFSRFIKEFVYAYPFFPKQYDHPRVEFLLNLPSSYVLGEIGSNVKPGVVVPPLRTFTFAGIQETAVNYISSSELTW